MTPPRAETSAPGPAPSRAYRLRADEDAASGVRRVILGRLDKAAERLREADDGDALAEAIHGARKDIKKARAALRLIREELGEKTFKRENRALRDAARMLSASRDAEVKLATLDSLAAGDGEAPPGAVAIWRDALAADRDRILGDEDSNGAGGGERGDGDGSPSAASATAVETASASAVAGAATGAGDVLETAAAAIDAVVSRASRWRIRSEGWALLAPGLDTAYRAGREKLGALPAEPDFDAVHELRKRGKDLWYQLRLLADAWPEVLGATAAEVHDFTDKLGDHHDLAVLAEDLRERDEIHFADREALEALIESRQAGLLAEARGLGARIYAEKPKAFGRRMRALWRASRRPTAGPSTTS